MLKSKVNTATEEGYDNIYLNQLYKKGLKVRVALAPEYFQILSDLYSPMKILPGLQQPPSGSHQLAAAHQSIAQDQLYAFVKNRQSYIEIGPNAANFFVASVGKTSPHGCTLRSPRDQSRHFRAAASNVVNGYRASKETKRAIATGGVSEKQLHQDVQALAAGIPTESFCLNGWQNCDVSAPVAISNHSLYDISFLDLAVGMNNHNCHYIRAFIHFPSEILTVNEWKSYEKGYHFKRVRKGDSDVVHFGWLGDTAFGYTHDYNTWIPYLTTGGFATPFGFNITIEKTAWHGSQFELAISRVTAGGAYYYTIPNALADLIRVPNFRAIAATDFCKRRFNSGDPKFYIVVDAAKIRKLLDYINARAEKGFTIDVVKGYARTLVSEVRLGNVLAEHRWNCTMTEFSDLCISIYLLSAYQRKLDRVIVDASLQHLSELGKSTSAFDHLCKWLGHRLGLSHHHAAGSEHHNTESARIAKQESTNIFDRCVMKFFDDYESHTQVTEAGYNEHVFFGYNTETVPDVAPTRDAIRAAATYVDPVIDPEGVPPTECPTWAREFSLVPTIRAELNDAYLSEEQHSTFIMECEQAALDVKLHDNLRATLRTASVTCRSRTPKKLHVENMFALTGVPGGAKTRMVRTQIIPTAITTGKVLVICPTRALADDYNQHLTAGSCEAVTTHTGLKRVNNTDYALVILEEAFTFPMAYINFIAERQPTLLVGDPCQIQHVDFSGLWQGCSKLEEYIKYIPRHHINITVRCPRDVTELPIIRSAYPGISSKGKQDPSIQFLHPRGDVREATIICFTQAQKALISSNTGRNVYTAHECQGRTFETTLLHFAGTQGEHMLLKHSPNHLVVALTRHCKHLYIRDGTEGELLTYINDTSPLTLIADQSNIDLAAMDLVPLPTAALTSEAVAPGVEFPFTRAECGTADLIISRYFPADAPRENVSTVSTQLNIGGDASGTIRLGELGSEEQFEQKTHRLHRFPVPQRVLNTKGHQHHHLLRTNLERLTHSTKNLGPTICDPLADRLFDRLADEFDWSLPENTHHAMFLQAVEKMQARGQDLGRLTEGVDWKEKYVNLVKSFLKDQQKPMMGKDPHTADKAGQGISAWEKTLNLIAAPWARALEQVLVNQSKGNCRVMSQLTDKAVMAILEQESLPGDKYLDNDWTKFDSNQNDLARGILARGLRKIGCPELLISRVMDQMKSRRVVTNTSSLTVSDKLDSGSPFTLINNCMFNLAICLDLMKGFRKLYIKGDDSLAIGQDLEFDVKNMDYYIKNCGFQFKPNASQSGQFVSFLLNRQGVGLDLPRICAKVLSRSYKNVEEFVEYQGAIQAQLIGLDLYSGVNTTKVNAFHYDGNVRTEPDFDVLLSFLFRFARGEIPFTELYESEAIHYKTDAPAASVCSNRIRLAQKRPGTAASIRRKANRALDFVMTSL